MTDLPGIQVPRPVPEADNLCLKAHIDWSDGHSERMATLEDVRAVLDAAGYGVFKKGDFKFDVRPFSFTQELVDEDDPTGGDPADFVPVEQVDGKLMRKTSGSPGGAPAPTKVVETSRPAEGRKEPGTIQFKSKEEMLGWFRAVSEAINRADGEIIGAAKLHEQVRDLEAKVVALDRLAIDAIECVEAVTYKGDGLVAGLKYRLESLK